MTEKLGGIQLLATAKRKREVGFTPQMISILCGYVEDTNRKQADLVTFSSAILDALAADNAIDTSGVTTIEERLRSKRLETFLEPQKSTETKPCHIYLVDSGNYDQVYKIGYTCNKRRRLLQIKDEYGVPNAIMQASAYVRTVKSAKTVEEELHTIFSKQRVNTYYGEEWFQLNESQVDEVKNFLNQQTEETVNNEKV